MQRINGTGPTYYRFEQWAADSPVIHGVFTRLGGASDGPWASLNLGGTVGDDPAIVRENHRRVYAALGLDETRACTVWQVHSADTVVVRERVPNRRWLARSDAMITDQPLLPLTMRFADCTPILLYDPARHAVGIVHAGWRGTVLDAAGSAVRSMHAAFGSNPADIQAGIGPSIGPERYQVGEEVVDAVRSAFGAADGVIRRAADGSAYLNLWAANRLALERAGVGQIEIAGICTATRIDEFYSHRAERGRTGRFGAVIALAG
ncbi:MAG: peptidoglycan editing factor PgeF [Chloroflexota bacterium]|mgnify:CR=1 FL=1|nr:peptidoglycan editing factor PgeF [Anaerolineae bacterium]HMM26815.1 peptidoglycan editing factor PgeF [Aggregatilineaceae bacterium]